MKIEVQIVSEELIQPSSPTPHHLRRLHLSFLDQIEPHLRIPFVFYYSNKSKIRKSEICNLLKKSLSKVLTTFYPIAGRVNNNSYIDCNDEGVLFVQASVNCQLSDILEDWIPSNNNYFIPPTIDEYDDLVAYSQITFLSCGGIVVSCGISHKIGDALSCISFINSWAATARGNDETINIPPFGSASLFPPMDMSSFGTNGALVKEKLVTKVFVFDRFAIASLKEKYTVSCGKRISDVLAAGGFISSRFMVTTVEKNKKYRLIQGVNLRTRMNPSLPMLSFGNYAIAAPLVEGNVDEEDNDYWFQAVKKMVDLTKQFNADDISKLQKEDGQFNFLRKIYPEFFGKDQDVVSITLSSIKGFPVYEVDFGWGKPLWFGTVPLVGKNIIFLVQTHDGLGIETWVCLKEEDMAKFEIDNKLLQYVSPPRTIKQDVYARL